MDCFRSVKNAGSVIVSGYEQKSSDQLHRFVPHGAAETLIR
jgi:hypothetical protein